MTKTLPVATTEAVGIEVDELLQRLRSADENSPQRIAGSDIFDQAAKEIVRLRNWIGMHRGDTASLNNEVELMREHWQAAEKLAAERKAENADLVKALEPFADIALERDSFPSGKDMIAAPDLSITPDDVRLARAALARSKAQGGE